MHVYLIKCILKKIVDQQKEASDAIRSSCSISLFICVREVCGDSGFLQFCSWKAKAAYPYRPAEVSIGLKGVLNNGCATYIPDVDGIEQPGETAPVVIKFQQITESTIKDDIAAGNRISCGSGEKLVFSECQRDSMPLTLPKRGFWLRLALLIIPILFRKFAFDNMIKLYQQRNSPGSKDL